MGAAHRRSLKVAVRSIMAALVLVTILLPVVEPLRWLEPTAAVPLRPTEIRQGRSEVLVQRVLAVKAHRDLARACVAAVRRQAPDIASSGKPTLIQVEGAFCGDRCGFTEAFPERHHALWTERGLNSIRVATAADRGHDPAQRRLLVPACAALISDRHPGTRLVLDRTGELFYAGDQESSLKARLWLPDPNQQASAHPAHARRGISILLESGHPLRDAEAVQMVTWARVCKWHLGECVVVAREQRAVRRLDATSAVKLVEAGEAEARRLDFYRSP